MVADKEGDNEEDENDLNHDGIVSGCHSHIIYGNHENDKDGYNVHIDSEKSVGELAVVIEGAVHSQKLACSGGIAVGNIDNGDVVDGLAVDQGEEIFEAI